MGILEKYPETVTFRVNEEQKMALFDLVEYHDISISTFCRQLVEKELRKHKRYVKNKN